MRVERIHFYWVGAFLLAVLIWQFGIVSTSRKFRELDARIVRKEKALEEIRSLAGEYIRMKKTAQDVRKTPLGQRKDYTPLPFLEKLSQESNVKYKLTYRTPRELKGEKSYMESSVSVELAGINMHRLLKYIYTAENSGEMLCIKNLHIKSAGGGVLNVNFEVSALVPAITLD